ncbi:MAG: FHA domain-containing protein [Myxococcales bacterium]|nr:FHA domain-containing protein [Myxococcales bacterium]
MAYSLTFMGEQDEQTVELSSELSVGRTNQNDVILNDQGVSRKHCRFFIGEDGQVYVEDLGSANGVQVDGVPISQPMPLSPDNEISIGKTKARLIASPSAGRSRSSARSSGGALARRDSPARGERGALRRRDSQERGPADQRGAIEPVSSSRRSMSAPTRGRSKSLTNTRAKAMKATSRGKLKCLSGPAEGDTFDLNGKPRLIVGRSTPADIILNDPSVARKHAEIYKVGSFFNVYDLGSPGGTLVNGEPVTETQLCPGDEITIGDYVFLYTGPGELRDASAGGATRKKYIFGGLAAAVLLGFAGMAVVAGEEEDVVSAPAQPGPRSLAAANKNDDNVDPLRLLGRCKALADIEGEQLNFKEAAQVCAKVLELDPTLTEARSLERLAKREIKFGEILEDAKLKSSTSQDETAIELLLQIEPDSMAFTQARQLFRDTSDRLAKRMRTQCLTEHKSGFYQQAFDACRRHMELVCNLEDASQDVVKTFSLAAKRIKASETFVCPETYAVFGKRVAFDDSNIERTIERHFPNKTVAKAMIEYYTTGRPKKIADDLKRAKAKSPKNFSSDVDELILKLEVIDGRYTSGQEGILRNDAARAEQFWKDAFDAEATFFPKGVESVLIRDMKAQLAKIYFTQGEDFMKKEFYGEAFKAYYTGYQYDAKNRDLLKQIAFMEQKASQFLRQDPGCETARLSASITIPKSGVNKRAEEMLIDYNCL